jgi:hypothetical protein
MQTCTIEIRDGRGVPRVQARIAAPDPAQAALLMVTADDQVEWVFLEELSGEDLTRLLREHHEPRAAPAASHPGSPRKPEQASRLPQGGQRFRPAASPATDHDTRRRPPAMPAIPEGCSSSTGTR